MEDTGSRSSTTVSRAPAPALRRSASSLALTASNSQNMEDGLADNASFAELAEASGPKKKKAKLGVTCTCYGCAGTSEVPDLLTHSFNHESPNPLHQV
jgi:hypothetical protein